MKYFLVLKIVFSEYLFQEFLLYHYYIVLYICIYVKTILKRFKFFMFKVYI